MNALSLFSNVGIGETYLKDIGINVVIANELLPERAKFYLHSHPNGEMIQGDITNKEVFNKIITSAKEKNIKLLIATPPCQGMSIAGQMKENDPRNSLIIKALEVFNILKPDYMLIENVIQMFKTSILYNGVPVKIVDFIKYQIGKDYEAKFDIFDAADYGTPQFRKRAIVRIYKKDLVWKDPVKQSQITVRDAIGSLPSLEAGQKSNIKYHEAKSHNANHILWMKHAPTGKSAFENCDPYKPTKDGRLIKGFTTTYKRISWDKPAPTITMANGSVSSQNNVHPGNKLSDGTYSDARVLTWLELFRLTALPDTWTPPYWAKDNVVREVIGEALMPMLLKVLLSGIKIKN
jgi:DNA (cytosine-5)-methyltransferase 1